MIKVLHLLKVSYRFFSGPMNDFNWIRFVVHCVDDAIRLIVNIFDCAQYGYLRINNFVNKNYFFLQNELLPFSPLFLRSSTRHSRSFAHHRCIWAQRCLDIPFGPSIPSKANITHVFEKRKRICINCITFFREASASITSAFWFTLVVK